MKSRLLIFSTLVSMHAASLYAAPSYYEALTDRLEKIGFDTFGIRPLLKDFNPKMLEKWDLIINEVSTFIKKNASGDKGLLNAMADLKAADTKMYRTILRLNQVIKAGSALNDAEYMQEGEDGLQALNDIEKEIDNAMEKVSDTYILSGRKKCRELLDTLEVILSETINTAQRSLIGTNWNQWRK